MNKAKILFLDIETRPLLVYCWGLFDQNIALNQIKEDWNILSWAAKWAGDPDKKTMYMDRSNSDNDRDILKGIWKLLDEADVVIGQNSKKFDIKKLNARFALNGMGPPSPFRQIDTLVLAKKYFSLTSNKLEYMSKNLCKKYKKMSHSKFPGFELWKECLAGNKEAWKEMKLYNIYDVLSLEELYNEVKKWDSSINFNVYNTENLINRCNGCGSTKLQKRGFNYTNAGQYQRYHCVSCGSWTQGKINLLSKAKKESLRK